MPALHGEPLQLVNLRTSPLVPDDAVDEADDDFNVVAVDVDSTLATGAVAAFLQRLRRAGVVAQHWRAEVVLESVGDAGFPRDGLDEAQEESVRPVAAQIAQSVQQRHVSAADARIGDLREERHRRAEHRVEKNLVTRIDGEDQHVEVDRDVVLPPVEDHRRRPHKDRDGQRQHQPEGNRFDVDVHRILSRRVLADDQRQQDLKRHQRDRQQREFVFRYSMVDEFERRHGVARCKADFDGQQDRCQQQHRLHLHDLPQHAVTLGDAVIRVVLAILVRLFFLTFEDGNEGRRDEERDAPEPEKTRQVQQALRSRLAVDVLVAELRRLQRHEHDVSEEVAGGLSNRIAG